MTTLLQRALLTHHHFGGKIFLSNVIVPCTYAHVRKRKKKPTDTAEHRLLLVMLAAWPRGNCNLRLENSHLQTGCLKTGHFEMPRFPCFELQRLDFTHL